MKKLATLREIPSLLGKSLAEQAVSGPLRGAEALRVAPASPPLADGTERSQRRAARPARAWVCIRTTLYGLIFINFPRANDENQLFFYLFNLFEI